MAKKKKVKETEAPKFRYSVELTGLLLILIAVLGSAPFGLVGKIIRNFEIFLMGNLYGIVFLLMLCLGFYMVVKRKLPNFFSTKMIGLYIVIIVLLTFAHSSYISTSKMDLKIVIQTTIDQFMQAADYYEYMSVGGGIIGALFSVLFITLFDSVGSKIVLAILAVFGIILLFDITFADVYGNFKEFLKKRREKIKEKVKKASSGSEESEDDKIFISNVNELYSPKTNPAPTFEEKEDYVSKENTNSEEYVLPSITIFDKPTQNKSGNTTETLKSNVATIESVLNDFQIYGKAVSIHEGPAVTQYEVDVKSGTKLSRITGIHRELALALAAKEVRIQAPIPGKKTVGIEVPNKTITPVKIREVLENVPVNMEKSNILVSLGKDVMGKTMTADLTKMPHLLVAGTTGSGKSVCINGFIASILLRYHPDKVKLVLVDPKKVELSNYKKVPHLYYPVITDPKEANIALKKIVVEMDRRYQLFAEIECKNMQSYNEYIEKYPSKNLEKLPYIVVIIDELADLMIVAAKEVEDSILRIAQMARAAGIHLIVATQRPSTDVISGIIKANIPSKIAFTVSNGIDSRTILDETGAEKLLGKGDMLYFPMGEMNPMRVQGAYVSDEELERLISFVAKQREADFSGYTLKESTSLSGSGSKDDYDDPMYNEVVEFAIRNGAVSASLLQRKFRLGFNRAARMIDLLEERGIVGPQNGSKPREVLVALENNED